MWSARAWLADIDAFFFPPTCVICGAIIRGSRIFLVCRACRKRFAPVDGDACLVCRSAGRGDVGFAAGRDCRDDAHRDARIHAAVRMIDPADTVVHALKFRDRPELGRTIALLIARSLRRSRAADWDLVTPLPLHRRRERERGYNQSRVVAEPLASLRRAEFEPRLLTRARATDRQADLDYAARATNVAGAFRIRERRGAATKARLAGRRILLVDDVATTGQTLRHALEALRATGAGRTGAAVFALA